MVRSTIICAEQYYFAQQNNMQPELIILRSNIIPVHKYRCAAPISVEQIILRSNIIAGIILVRSTNISIADG